MSPRSLSAATRSATGSPSPIGPLGALVRANERRNVLRKSVTHAISSNRIEPARGAGGPDKVEKESTFGVSANGGCERRRFFIWIRRNPLKSPDSDEWNQAELLGLIWCGLD